MHSSTLFHWLPTCIVEPTLYSPPTPMSSVSITGNNRPSSFIAGWRRFPHGATGSQWCQPASPPPSTAAERKRIKCMCQLSRFLIVLQGGDLTHSIAALISETEPGWWTEASQPHKVTYIYIFIRHANWQGLRNIPSFHETKSSQRSVKWLVLVNFTLETQLCM